MCTRGVKTFLVLCFEKSSEEKNSQKGREGERRNSFVSNFKGIFGSNVFESF